MVISNKWIKGSLLFLLGLILVAVVSFLVLLGVYWLQINQASGSLQTGSQARSYLLYVPESIPADQAVPLVISLHGYVEWPAHQQHISKWNQVADEHGFIVVYPSGSGLPLRWRAWGREDIQGGMQADIQFIADLIDHLQAEYNIDSRRIYVNGLSNGAGMSFALACNLSDRIAAFGGVAGAYMLPWDACQPERPVPAILFHGTEDPIVPYMGGPSASFHVDFPVIPDWVETLAIRNGCSLPAIDLPAQGEVSGLHYSNCREGADVVFYRIAGGGHSWPGGNPLPERITGPTSQDIDASRVMWAFFEQHPLVK